MPARLRDNHNTSGGTAKLLFHKSPLPSYRYKGLIDNAILQRYTMRRNIRRGISISLLPTMDPYLSAFSKSGSKRHIVPNGHTSQDQIDKHYRLR